MVLHGVVDGSRQTRFVFHPIACRAITSNGLTFAYILTFLMELDRFPIYVEMFTFQIG
jgi:hypothetical protein